MSLTKQSEKTTPDDYRIQSDNKRSVVRLALLWIAPVGLLLTVIVMWEGYKNSSFERLKDMPSPIVEKALFESNGSSELPVLIMYVRLNKQRTIPITEVVVKPQMVIIHDNPIRKACYQDLNNSEFKYSHPQGTLTQDGVTPVTLVIKLPQSCTDGGWDFVADVTFIGHDEAGGDYKQQAPTPVRAKVVG